MKGNHLHIKIILENLLIEVWFFENNKTSTIHFGVKQVEIEL